MSAANPQSEVSAPRHTTAEEVAEELGVSRATIERDGAYAEAVVIGGRSNPSDSRGQK